MAFRVRAPTPGIEKILSMISEPPRMPMNSPKMPGTMTTKQFRRAWRMVAWAFVSPLVRASSINSEVSTSVSSARVVRVNPAITPKERLSTGGTMERNISREK